MFTTAGETRRMASTVGVSRASETRCWGLWAASGLAVYDIPTQRVEMTKQTAAREIGMMGGIYSPYPNHSDAWFGRSSRSPAKDIPETPVWAFASEQFERLLDAFEGGAARFAELNTIGSKLIRSGVGRTHFFSLQARKSVFFGHL